MTENEPAGSPKPAKDLVPEAAAKRRRNIIIIVVVAGLLVMIFADWFMRNREMDRLMDAVEVSEKTMVSGNESVLDQARVGSTRLGQFPLNEDRERERRRLAEAAGDAASSVLDSGAAVDEVFVLPWHFAIKRAQARYGDHSEAWSDNFEGAAKDLARFLVLIRVSSRPSPSPSARLEKRFHPSRSSASNRE